LIRAPRPCAEPPRAVSRATRRALRCSGESGGSDTSEPAVTSGCASALSGSPNSHSKLAGPTPRLSAVIAGGVDAPAGAESGVCRRAGPEGGRSERAGSETRACARAATRVGGLWTGAAGGASGIARIGASGIARAGASGIGRASASGIATAGASGIGRASASGIPSVGAAATAGSVDHDARVRAAASRVDTRSSFGSRAASTRAPNP
jgi:hypothetical protein